MIPREQIRRTFRSILIPPLVDAPAADWTSHPFWDCHLDTYTGAWRISTESRVAIFPNAVEPAEVEPWQLDRTPLNRIRFNHSFAIPICVDEPGLRFLRDEAELYMHRVFPNELFDAKRCDGVSGVLYYWNGERWTRNLPEWLR